MTKFALAREHRLYYEKHQLLELEGVFDPLQLQHLRISFENLMNQKMSQRSFRLSKREAGYLTFRDLWRENEIIRKFVLSKELASIAAELSGAKMVRLAYDQFYVVPLKNDSLATSPSISLSPSPSHEASLQEISCVQGILGGAIICLKSLAEPMEKMEASPFPLTAGNVVLLSAEKKMDFEELSQRTEQEFLLICYAAKTAIYYPNEQDPYFHDFKHLGYVFGDKLSDTLHPILFRR